MGTASPPMAAAIRQIVFSEFRSRGRMLRDGLDELWPGVCDPRSVMNEVEQQIHEAAVNCRRRLATRLRTREARRLTLDEQVELVAALKFAAARARCNAVFELGLATSQRVSARTAMPAVRAHACRGSAHFFAQT